MKKVKPIKANELCLSGFFGKKLLAVFEEGKIEHSSYIKEVYEFDGYEIYLQENNHFETYGFFSDLAEMELIKKFNDYIENLINSINDENFKEKIIEIANNDISRNSNYHIFNMEMLVSSVKKRPACFNLIYSLIQEKEFYNYVGKNYEYYLFAIFDAKTDEQSEKIYQSIIEEIIIDYEDGYRRVKKTTEQDLKRTIDKEFGEEEQQKIEKNLQLIKIN